MIALLATLILPQAQALEIPKLTELQQQAKVALRKRAAKKRAKGKVPGRRRNLSKIPSPTSTNAQNHIIHSAIRETDLAYPGFEEAFSRQEAIKTEVAELEKDRRAARTLKSKREVSLLDTRIDALKGEVFNQRSASRLLGHHLPGDYDIALEHMNLVAESKMRKALRHLLPLFLLVPTTLVMGSNGDEPPISFASWAHSPKAMGMNMSAGSVEAAMGGFEPGN